MKAPGNICLSRAFIEVPIPPHLRNFLADVPYLPLSPLCVAPFGFPALCPTIDKDVRVIAWGLSLERPTMIKYGITNIRELFGHKADLNRTKTAPVCRFD